MERKRHARFWNLWTVYAVVQAFLLKTDAVTYKPLAPQRPSDDTTFYQQEYKTEAIFKNQELPYDVEITLYVELQEPRRLLFKVNQGSSVWLTVTPCETEIEWRLFPRSYTTSVDESWYKRLMSEDDSDDFAPVFAKYIGTDRRTFYHENLPFGYYVLEIGSRSQDSSIRVFLTKTKSQAVTFYPVLPEEDKVRILKVRKDSAVVFWKPVENTSRETEYCAAVNINKNFQSLCGFNKLSNEVLQVPNYNVPNSAMYKWKTGIEKQTRRPRATSQVHCIGNRTWNVFRNLEEGVQYYFDVFVLNKQTNGSSTYKGTVASTRMREHEESSVKLNELIVLQLTKKAEYSLRIRFSNSTRKPQAWIFVQSCSGPGPVFVKIARDSSVVLEAPVMESKTFELKELLRGIYTISVSSKVNKERTVRLWLTRKYHRYPFPSLPEDKKIKVFDTLTTCRSVTLAWKTTEDEKVRYCLYKKSTVSSNTRNVLKNTCDDTFVSSTDRTRILCRRYHRFSKHRFNNVIIQKVQSLRLNTTYVFEVLVTKLRGKTLSYDPVWVTTSHTCSD